MEDPHGPGKLKRSLSLSLLTFCGIGTILGMGIYVLLGKIGGEAGTLAPFAFLVAAFLAGFTALSFGELAFRMATSAKATNYILLFVFTLVNASLIVIKRRGPAPKGVTTFPI